MPELLGNIIVLALLALAAFGAVRSLLRKEKRAAAPAGVTAPAAADAIENLGKY